MDASRDKNQSATEDYIELLATKAADAAISQMGWAGVDLGKKVQYAHESIVIWTKRAIQEAIKKVV